MRYQALEIYSGLLRAVGVLMIVAGLIFGGGLVLMAMSFTLPVFQAVGVMGASFAAVFGLLAGLGALASGQLLCVWIDIEANTRTLIHREWDLDRD